MSFELAKRYIVKDKGSYRWSRLLDGAGGMQMEFIPDREVHYVAASGLTPDIQQAQVFSDNGTPRALANKAKFLARPEEYEILPVVIFTQDLLAQTLQAALEPLLVKVLTDASQ